MEKPLDVEVIYEEASGDPEDQDSKASARPEIPEDYDTETSANTEVT